MRQVATAAAVLVLVGSAAVPAHAGPAADALGKCLVESSTGKDRIVLVQWIFAALSVHPDVREVAPISQDTRDGVTRQMAAVFERLMTVDCRDQTLAAYREDGVPAISEGFEALGRIAVLDLQQDPGVQREMSKLDNYIDPSKFTALFGQAPPK
jgi:hypothetical protein